MNKTNHTPIHNPLTTLTASMVLGNILVISLFGYVPLAMTVGGLITVSVLAKKLKLNG